MTAVLSIIIPAYNEAHTIEDYLILLQPYRQRGVDIILVDGGSQDGTQTLAAPYVDQLVCSQLGRGSQMNAGAQCSSSQYVLFLHADTQLPEMADAHIIDALGKGKLWGRFDISLSGDVWMLSVISYFINLRSRLSGIATGDQGLFMSREAFDQVGGFPEQPLMEDIELTSRLKRLSAPVCLSEKVISSGRRWQTYGVWRTIFLMWRLRYRYWRGADSHELAKEYRSNY